MLSVFVSGACMAHIKIYSVHFGDLLEFVHGTAVCFNTKHYRIMTGNDISSLSPTNFSAYPNLETLVLNDNQLTVIPTGALENLPRLTNL